MSDDQKTEPRLIIKDYNKTSPRVEIGDYQKTEPHIKISDYENTEPNIKVDDCEKTKPHIKLKINDSNKRKKKATAKVNDQQRTHPRYKITLNVTIKGIDRDFKCETKDLSLNGLFIKTAHKFEDNQYLELSIEVLPLKSEIEVLGKIVHAIPGYGIGLKFIDYFDNAKKMLVVLVEYVQNQNKE